VDAGAEERRGEGKIAGERAEKSALSDIQTTGRVSASKFYNCVERGSSYRLQERAWFNSLF